MRTRKAKAPPTRRDFFGLASRLAAVTHDQFNQLPYPIQLARTCNDGTFLATRWQAENEAGNLDSLPGRFCVEVTYDTAANGLLGLRSFHHAKGLEEYAVSVRLPDWLLLCLLIAARGQNYFKHFRARAFYALLAFRASMMQAKTTKCSCCKVVLSCS